MAACLALVPGGPRPRALVGLDAVDGRVTAAPVTAPAPIPGFDNSAMDGYAVRCADVAGATAEAPVVLPVAADVPAGSGRPAPLRPGTAVRIMTGAPVPDGADAIVQVEWTDAATDRVSVFREPVAAMHVRRAGEDVQPGDVVLAAGTRLAPRHVALLAAVGVAELEVIAAPRVVVVSTGSELVTPGTPLRFGQIHDSNGWALAAAARRAGADAVYAGNVTDSTDGVVAALLAAAEGADLVLTSGGVSAGAYDVVKLGLRELGTVAFGKVAMQPGSPQGCGVLPTSSGPVPVLTFPGNPVSALVSFEVFGRPVIRRLAGEAVVVPPLSTYPVAAGWAAPAGRIRFLRARREQAADGRVVVRPLAGQGSHQARTLADSDCLVVVPAGVDCLAEGDPVQCLVLDE